MTKIPLLKLVLCLAFLFSIILRKTHCDKEYHLANTLHKKLSFPLKISSGNVTKSAADLVTFTEEIFNGKLDFLCSVTISHMDSKRE